MSALPEGNEHLPLDGVLTNDIGGFPEARPHIGVYMGALYFRKLETTTLGCLQTIALSTLRAFRIQSADRKRLTRVWVKQVGIWGVEGMGLHKCAVAILFRFHHIIFSISWAHFWALLPCSMPLLKEIYWYLSLLVHSRAGMREYHHHRITRISCPIPPGGANKPGIRNRDPGIGEPGPYTAACILAK